MLFDSHVHLGQFYAEYTSPQDLVNLMQSLGVGGYLVSSTTTCEKNFDKVLSEIRETVRIDEDRAIPAMWISPEILDDPTLRNKFLDGSIGWRCMKIHPDWQPWVWLKREKIDAAIALSCELNVPLLIHTGAKEYSEANIWEEVIKENPLQTFILAHCRPFEQAVRLMSTYPNVYGDLAFVNSDNFNAVSKAGISDKVMWGSDLPIVSHFIEDSITNYYQNRLRLLRDAVSEEEFQKITESNFAKLFKL